MFLIPYFTLFSFFLISLTSYYRLGAVLFALCFSLSTGILNSGKVVESDLKDYMEWFLLSGELPFWQYLLFKGNDFLFFIYNYFFFHFVSTSPKFYIFFTTVISYLIIFFSGYKVLSSHPDIKPKLFTLCVSLMFPLIFVNSGHLVRQLVAGAIVVFALYGVKDRKHTFWIFIIAGLIHSSALLFVLFMFAPISKLTITKSVMVVGIIILVISILKLLTFKSLGIPFIDVIYSRLVQQDNADLKMSIIAICAVFVPLIMYFWDKKFVGHPFEKQNLQVALLCLAIVTFYIIPSFIELSLRYSFYLWIILPVYLATKVNLKFNNVLMLLIISVQYFLFLFYSANNQWDYACGYRMLFTFQFGFDYCNF
jgi:hypothetical protein